MIKRDPNKIPNPLSNPAAGVIEDMIEHHGLTQVAVANAMGIKASLLNAIIKNKRGVSAEVALRFEHCFGLSAKVIMELQAEYDFNKAYHAKFKALKQEVKPLVKMVKTA